MNELNVKKVRSKKVRSSHLLLAENQKKIKAPVNKSVKKSKPMLKPMSFIRYRSILKAKTPDQHLSDNSLKPLYRKSSATCAIL